MGNIRALSKNGMVIAFNTALRPLEPLGRPLPFPTSPAEPTKPLELRASHFRGEECGGQGVPSLSGVPSESFTNRSRSAIFVKLFFHIVAILSRCWQ
jgi:hypothetical protein